MWIRFPSTENELRMAMRSWQRIKQFPNAIGAIDCTHVRINKPTIHGDEYVNRKGYASLNVQAICNAKEIFISVECQWPGSVHDARIWANSHARTAIESTNIGAVLIGDQGYGISPWIMNPFRNPAAPHERAYNKLHTKERVLIERTFGQIKSKFPFLRGSVRVKTERIPRMVVACFVLHNISKFLREEDSEDEEIDTEFLQMPNVTGAPDVRGRQYRNSIAQYINNNP